MKFDEWLYDNRSLTDLIIDVFAVKDDDDYKLDESKFNELFDDFLDNDENKKKAFKENCQQLLDLCLSSNVDTNMLSQCLDNINSFTADNNLSGTSIVSFIMSKMVSLTQCISKAKNKIDKIYSGLNFDEKQFFNPYIKEVHESQKNIRQIIDQASDDSANILGEVSLLLNMVDDSNYSVAAILNQMGIMKARYDMQEIQNNEAQKISDKQIQKYKQMMREYERRIISEQTDRISKNMKFFDYSSPVKTHNDFKSNPVEVYKAMERLNGLEDNWKEKIHNITKYKEKAEIRDLADKREKDIVVSTIFSKDKNGKLDLQFDFSYNTGEVSNAVALKLDSIKNGFKMLNELADDKDIESTRSEAWKPIFQDMYVVLEELSQDNLPQNIKENVDYLKKEMKEIIFNNNCLESFKNLSYETEQLYEQLIKNDTKNDVIKTTDNKKESLKDEFVEISQSKNIELAMEIEKNYEILHEFSDKIYKETACNLGEYSEKLDNYVKDNKIKPDETLTKIINNVKNVKKLSENNKVDFGSIIVHISMIKSDCDKYLEDKSNNKNKILIKELGTVCALKERFAAIIEESKDKHKADFEKYIKGKENLNYKELLKEVNKENKENKEIKKHNVNFIEKVNKEKKLKNINSKENSFIKKNLNIDNQLDTHK